jgi:hypothetical protein
VAVIDPFSPVAYLSGLRAAQALEDRAGIEWACSGILSQAWPYEQRSVEQHARQVAEGLLVELRKEGQPDEAARFEADIQQARQRDCVVVVKWNGDADVDLAVVEPSGTICSLQNPRSTSGGVMLGDTFARQGASSVKGYSEVYVCPQGFSGEYRMLVKKVWGKVSAGLVTVDIYTHYGTKDQTHIHQNIPLGQKDALIVFDLNQGRRKEALAEEQVANVAKAQLNVNRAVLAQQIGGAGNDDSSLRDLALAWRRGVNLGRFAMNRPGAVGFAPVIQTFPQGNQMSCMAVISADRRYVRFSLLGSQPVSSGISDLTTFNFVTGQGQQQNAGIGQLGQGGGGCWVAREVYGNDNPKWIVFRDWLHTDAPRWLCNLYTQHGEEFAGWIKDKPQVKSAIRTLMDQAIEGRTADGFTVSFGQVTPPDLGF